MTKPDSTHKASDLARAAYLGLFTGARRGLDGTSVLRAWDNHVAAHPRSRSAHLRTLLAVHNAEDLVRMDLPWWTYAAIDAVAAFLQRREDARVFEYGSGASTVWLARRAASVDAVEHDGAWAQLVRRLLSDVDGLRCTPTVHVPQVPRSDTPEVASAAPTGRGLDFAAYVHAIDTVPGQFDLILIDGRARAQVLGHVLDRVSAGGLVLLDDAQRSRYSRAVTEAGEQGWYVRRTRGATPCQPMPRETVLLSRDPAALRG